jgi:hypothetical protein
MLQQLEKLGLKLKNEKKEHATEEILQDNHFYLPAHCQH